MMMANDSSSSITSHKKRSNSNSNKHRIVPSSVPQQQPNYTYNNNNKNTNTAATTTTTAAAAKTSKRRYNRKSNSKRSNNNSMPPSASFHASSSVMHSVGALSGTGTSGTPIARVRTPHAHDVLSGRGGGINAHPGNVQFRVWVRERKAAYTQANNKASKARVAQQVIDKVRQQSPPGRFLQKDPSFGGALGGWWVELDADKVLAKTSQALREGAPQLRAARVMAQGIAPAAAEVSGVAPSTQQHQRKDSATVMPPPPVPVVSAPQNLLGVSPFVRGNSKKRNYPFANVHHQQQQQEQRDVVAELRANAEQAGLAPTAIISTAVPPTDPTANALHHFNMPPLVEPEDDDADNDDFPSLKRARVIEEPAQDGANDDNFGEAPTPPLTAGSNDLVPPPLNLAAARTTTSSMPPRPPQPSRLYRRSNSLALSDTSLLDSLAVEDFVNPFDDDDDDAEFFKFMERQPSDRRCSSNDSSYGPPRPGVCAGGVVSEVSNDDAGVRALLRQNSVSSSNGNNNNNNNNHARGGANNSNDLTDPLYFFLWATRGGNNGKNHKTSNNGGNGGPRSPRRVGGGASGGPALVATQ